MVQLVVRGADIGQGVALLQDAGGGEGQFRDEPESGGDVFSDDGGLIAIRQCRGGA